MSYSLGVFRVLRKAPSAIELRALLFDLSVFGYGTQSNHLKVFIFEDLKNIIIFKTFSDSMKRPWSQF